MAAIRDLGGQHLEPLAPPGYERQHRAPVRQLPRCLVPDPARSTRQQHPPVRQGIHAVLSLYSTVRSKPSRHFDRAV
jgi:hypothetical protein